MLGYKGLIIRSLESPVDSWVKGNTAVRCDLLTGCLLPWCRTVDDLRAPASASRLVHPAPPSDPSQDCRSAKAQNCSIKDYVAAYLWDCCTQIIAICTLTNVWFHIFCMCNWLTCTVPLACTAATPHVHQAHVIHVIVNYTSFKECSNMFAIEKSNMCSGLHANACILLSSVIHCMHLLLLWKFVFQLTRKMWSWSPKYPICSTSVITNTVSLNSMNTPKWTFRSKVPLSQSGTLRNLHFSQLIIYKNYFFFLNHEE